MAIKAAKPILSESAPNCGKGARTKIQAAKNIDKYLKTKELEFFIFMVVKTVKTI